jgi:transcriptional regulator with XRE-family HTH domain
MLSADAQSALDRSLAAVIREVRRRQGMSQETLGFRSGLHRTYISLVERSRRSLTVGSLARIAAALGARPSELLAQAELAAAQSTQQARRIGQVGLRP